MCPKPIRRISTATSAFTAANPEHGFWWHALDGTGAQLFSAHSLEFGRPTPETTGTPLEGIRCIRCRPCRQEVIAWLPPNGAILCLNRSQIADADWIIAGQQNDIHVRASAAESHGSIEVPCSAEINHVKP